MTDQKGDVAMTTQVKGIWLPGESYAVGVDDVAAIVSVPSAYVVVYNNQRTRAIKAQPRLIHWSDPERLTREELGNGAIMTDLELPGTGKTLRAGVDGILCLNVCKFSQITYIYVLTRDWQVERYDYRGILRDN